MLWNIESALCRCPPCMKRVSRSPQGTAVGFGATQKVPDSHGARLQVDARVGKLHRRGRGASRTRMEDIRRLSSIRGSLALRSILCTAPYLSAVETRAPVTELACYYSPGSRAELRGRCLRPNQIHVSLLGVSKFDDFVLPYRAPVSRRSTSRPGNTPSRLRLLPRLYVQEVKI